MLTCKQASCNFSTLARCIRQAVLDSNVVTHFFPPRQGSFKSHATEDVTTGNKRCMVLRQMPLMCVDDILVLEDCICMFQCYCLQSVSRRLLENSVGTSEDLKHLHAPQACHT